MIESRRTTRERGQIMHRVQNIHARVIAAAMDRDHGLIQHDLHAIHIAFDRDRLKRGVPRHAVIDVVEPRELVLVDLRGLSNAGIEAMLGQRSGPTLLLREPLADRLRLTAATAIEVFQTAIPKIRIEFLQIVHARHGRGPPAFQGLHPVLDHRLLIPPRRQTEQGPEHIMAGQGLIPRIDLPRPSAEKFLGDRFGIVPPDLFGHAAEKLERLDHAVQNRLGPLRGQSHSEGRIGIGPHQNQNIDLPAAFGKVHPNLAEVGFDPLARSMIQGNERLGVGFHVAADKPPDGVVAAGVTLLVAQPLKDPLSRVPLLRRLGFVVPENLQDALVKPLQLRGDLPSPFGIGPGFAGAA